MNDLKRRHNPYKLLVSYFKGLSINVYRVSVYNAVQLPCNNSNTYICYYVWDTYEYRTNKAVEKETLY
jgi:hypothetical protein